jgi:hypothetical protein
VEVVQDRLREARREAEVQACTYAEHRGAQCRRGLRAQPHEQHGHGSTNDEDRQQQALRRRVVHACVGIADEYEQRKPDDDDSSAQHLPAHDVLSGQPVPERQRPDDRRDEQRLDDDEPAAI